MEKRKGTGKRLKIVKKAPSVRDYQEYLLKTLRSPDEAAGYLNAVVEGAMQDDPDTAQAVILLALRNIADAQVGLTKLAKVKEFNRAALYRMLSKSGNPRLESFFKILDAVGLELAVRPKMLGSTPRG